MGNLAAPWLAAAFAIGTRGTTRRAAAVAGAATLACAAVTHYIPVWFLRGDLRWELVWFPLGAWVLIGVGAGLTFGILGAAYASRDPLGVAGVAILASCFAAEAAILWVLEVPAARSLAVPLEIAAAIVLPPALYRTPAERRAVIVRAALVAPLVALTLGALVVGLGRVYPIP